MRAPVREATKPTSTDSTMLKPASASIFTPSGGDRLLLDQGIARDAHRLLERANRAIYLLFRDGSGLIGGEGSIDRQPTRKNPVHMGDDERQSHHLVELANTLLAEVVETVRARLGLII